MKKTISILMVTLLAFSILLTSCGYETMNETHASKNTEATLPTKPVSDNPLIAAELHTSGVLNGSMTELIGTRAYINISKDTLRSVTLEEYAEFCETIVADSGHNWVSIICDDGTGIQFYGSMVALATYGEMDYEGNIAQSIGYINQTETGFEYETIEEDTSQNNIFRVGNLEFTLDSGMSVEESGENVYTVTLIQDKAMLAMFAADVSNLSEDLVSAYIEIQHKTVTEDADHSFGVTELDMEICGFPTIAESYGVVNENTSAAYMDISFTDSWFAYSFHYVAAVVDNDDAYECGKLCGEFIATAKYVGDTPRDISSGASNPTSSDTATIGEQNTLESAGANLKYSAFSYSGLIDQLEYEGYTTAEATYAANNCGANWKEQALKSAQSYLNYSVFSYTGLIKQLEYEGFTTEEATYGADNCGADWFEQAAKSAETYLMYSSFSRQSLIDQLEYEGFTHEQAVYGAEANGY